MGQDRDGFVMGEGAGVVVLESLERQKKRSANLCRNSRYGLSGDAYHITAPAADGDGGFRQWKMQFTMEMLISIKSII